MIRKGFSILESLVVLIIVGGMILIGCCSYRSPSVKWQHFREAFHHAFINERMKGTQFTVRFRKEYVLVGDNKLNLPAGWKWHFGPPALEFRPNFMGHRPTTEYFVYHGNKQYQQIVFQLGGGTYDFR